MIFLKETNCIDYPAHTYLLENRKSYKIVGYIKEGTDKIIMFPKPLSFDRRKRTFKEVQI